MKRMIVTAGLLALMPGLALAFEPVPQDDYIFVTRCLADIDGATDLVDQVVEDLAEYDAEGALAEFRSLADDLAELGDYVNTLLDELEHPDYGLDHEEADLAYDAAYDGWDELLALSVEERMAVVADDAYTLDISEECFQIAERIEAAVNLNLDTGAIVWDD